MDPLAELDLFHGEATNRAAYVFARLPRGAEDAEGATLSGEITGPCCRHAQTLPVQCRLADAGPGPTLLARAVLPDPSCWSPELPMLYRVRVRLARRGKTIAECERPLAIRRLGPRGKDFLYEGRRWVLRGITSESVVPEEIAACAWRNLGAAKVMLWSHSSRECQLASEEGMLLIPWFLRNAPAAAEARQYAGHAAVAIAAIPAESASGAEVFRQFAPNVLRAAVLSAQDTSPCPAWAQLAIVHAVHGRGLAPDEHPALIARRAAELSVPVIAARPLAQPRSLDKARAAVDELQRDLAPFGDFAGYLV